MAKKGNIAEKSKLTKKFIALISIFLIFITFLSVAYSYYHSKISLLNYDNGKPNKYEITEEIESETMQPEKIDTDKIAEGLEEKEVVNSNDKISSSEDVLNILLIGTDERSKEFRNNARGDTCMLLSINKTNGKVKLVSFERATAVPILDGKYKGQYDWLTHSFRYGGADLMMREIRECFRIDVNRYIRINISTFIEGINAVGGVDINLSPAEADYINHPEKTYAKWHIKEMKIENEVQHVTPGLNHLNGETAMLYARCRAIDSDWVRVKRQQKVMQAAINQTKTLSVSEIDSTLNTVLPLVQTNLTESEITKLLLIAPKFRGAKIESMTLPQKGTYGGMKGMGGRSMFATNFKENAEILRDFIY